MSIEEVFEQNAACHRAMKTYDRLLLQCVDIDVKSDLTLYNQISVATRATQFELVNHSLDYYSLGKLGSGEALAFLKLIQRIK